MPPGHPVTVGGMSDDPHASGRPLRLAIVNDYALVVAGVAAMVAPYCDRIEVVELVSGLKAGSDVDLVLYDTFSAPQGSAMDVSSVIEEGSPAKLVVYSWNLDPELVSQALESGASGYLSKGLDAGHAVSNLEAIHDGKIVVPEGTGVVSPRGENPWPGKVEGLSVRESEIVALITRGLTNQEIARRTYLSINSVKTYIRTAYRKMGVERRAQAVLWGIKHGFEPDVVRQRQDPTFS
jgi:two-component system, NarL family, response regulator LiaR